MKKLSFLVLTLLILVGCKPITNAVSTSTIESVLPTLAPSATDTRQPTATSTPEPIPTEKCEYPSATATKSAKACLPTGYNWIAADDDLTVRYPNGDVGYAYIESRSDWLDMVDPPLQPGEIWIHTEYEPLDDTLVTGGILQYEGDIFDWKYPAYDEGYIYFYKLTVCGSRIWFVKMPDIPLHGPQPTTPGIQT